MPNRSTARPVRKSPAKRIPRLVPQLKKRPGIDGEDAYWQLLENLQIGVALASPLGELFYANARFCEIIMGPAFREASGKNLTSFIETSSWKQLNEALSRGASEPMDGETTVITSDGGQRSVRLSFSPFSRKPPSVQVVATDITDLAQAKEALRRSNDSVHFLSARLLHLQDEERRKLARDLHDTTGQELAVAVMTLDSLSRNLEKPGVNIRKTLAEATQWLRNVESGIRTFSYLLHPPLLDEMGLGSALTWYIEGFAERSGIQVELSIPEDLPRLPVQAETALFRITQECLSNVLRHSQSHKAWVSVSVNSRELKLIVRDEGKGFDHHSLTGRPNLGVGIEGMKGRLKLLNGLLDVKSGPVGTVVAATVPLPSSASCAAKTARTPHERMRQAETVVAGTKRLLIADDHEVARQGIRFLLSEEPGLEVCGEAESGAEALAKTLELHPDLIILDLNMPGGGGFSAARQIRGAGLATKILIYTTHAYAGLERVARAIECDGFVVKAEAGKDLIRGIHAVLRGETFFSVRGGGSWQLGNRRPPRVRP